MSVEQIVAWADSEFAQTGRWPNQKSGAVFGVAGETWKGVEHALINGTRGLAGGSSLAKLREDVLGVRNIMDLPVFTEDQILEWADSHRRCKGEWPNKRSGQIAEAPTETWSTVDTALRKGGRGLLGNKSLAKLLHERRGRRSTATLPMLTEDQVLAWADAFHTCSGKWPQGVSGPVSDVPGETWASVDYALKRGQRGLVFKGSLATFLFRRAGSQRQAISRQSRGNRLWRGRMLIIQELVVGQRGVQVRLMNRPARLGLASITHFTTATGASLRVHPWPNLFLKNEALAGTTIVPHSRKGRFWSGPITTNHGPVNGRKSILAGSWNVQVRVGSLSTMLCERVLEALVAALRCPDSY